MKTKHISEEAKEAARKCHRILGLGYHDQKTPFVDQWAVVIQEAIDAAKTQPTRGLKDEK